MILPLSDLIANAYKEDIPNGDLATDFLEVESIAGRAKLIAKSDLVLSGSELFEKSILYMEPKAQLKWHFKNGDVVLKSQVICVLKCNLVQLLKAERVALNFLGRLCGIASLTRMYANKVKHTNTLILDTRKTTPLMRGLEKQAVKDGGGRNHRMSLSDFPMIKENHVRIWGDLATTIEKVRRAHPFLEVEAHSIEDVQVCVSKNVNRILLDNFTTSQIREALSIIPHHIETEASGNMTLDRVAEVAETGVQYISVGALTHSAPSSDISLLFEFPE